MTKQEFDSFVRTYNALWNVTFDEAKIKVWYGLLGDLKIIGLINTLNSLATRIDRPSIKDIVEEYTLLKQVNRKQRIEAQHQRLLETSAEQEKCPICDNKGFILYDKYYDEAGPYQTYVRCNCLHGKDLNQYSEYQITKGKLWYNPERRKNENLYIPDVEDVFNAEEIAIIKIRNAEKRQETKFDDAAQQTIAALAGKFGLAR